MESIVSNKLTHEQEVAQVDSLVKLHVETLLRSGDEEVGVKLFLQFLDELNTFLQAFGGAAHTHVLPHDVAKLLVDRVDRTLTLDVHQTVDFLFHALFSLFKLRQISRNTWPYILIGQIVLNRVRQYEVTIGQALHQCGSTEAVGTVVREVTFTDGKQALDGSLQLVVNPDTTHRIVDSGEDHHRVIIFHTVDFVGEFTRIHIGDFLIHIKEVTIALANDVDTKALDRLREVEEYSQTRVVHTEALVTTLLGST